MERRNDDEREWLEEVERLRQENLALRASSESFADLAERLQKRLHEEIGTSAQLLNRTTIED
jgi:hypothetical protein